MIDSKISEKSSAQMEIEAGRPLTPQEIRDGLKNFNALPKRLKLSDLVVLTYASNNCYTHIHEAENLSVKGLEINLDEKTWTYIPSPNSFVPNSWKNIPIGKARPLNDSVGDYREGVIGVYDRTQIKDLNSINSASAYFTTKRKSWLED